MIKQFATETKAYGLRTAVTNQLITFTKWFSGAQRVIYIYDKAKETKHISDGFHTFKELYDYRLAYHALAVNNMAGKGFDVHKSKKHSDGEPCFGGEYFVVVMQLPTGQVTNHYKLKYWNYFKCEIRVKAADYDGHTPHEALKRIKNYVK